jgi:Putative quorum-sensing-regulated virulence factor
MSLPPKAQKLILLMMDGAAAPNEQEIAARKLADCLRKHYVDGFELLADWNRGRATAPPPPPPPKPSGESPYARFIIPFGMHKGKPLKEVPTEYLLWVLDWQDLFPRTRTAIEKYLAQER